MRERTREDRKAPRSKAKPKQKIKLTKLKRTQKVRDGLKKIGYNSKVVEVFGGIVECINNQKLGISQICLQIMYILGI